MISMLQGHFEIALKFHGHKCPAMPMVERVTKGGDFVFIPCSDCGS